MKLRPSAEEECPAARTVVSHRTIRRKCPTCGRRTSQFARDYTWYGWLVTCLSCGEAWQDGEMLPRPFKTGWRMENVKAAKRARRFARLAGGGR